MAMENHNSAVPTMIYNRVGKTWRRRPKQKVGRNTVPCFYLYNVSEGTAEMRIEGDMCLHKRPPHVQHTWLTTSLL